MFAYSEDGVENRDKVYKQQQHLACADRRCRSENSYSCAVSREVNRHHTAYAGFLFSFF